MFGTVVVGISTTTIQLYNSMSTLTTHTTASRDSHSIGLCKFNTTSKAIEVSDGTNWLIYDYDDTTAFKNRSAVTFDGAGDKMTASSTSDFAFGTSGFTISFWMKPNGTNNSSGFGVNILDMRSAVTQAKPSLWMSSVGSNSILKYYANGAYRAQTSSVTINSGTWYHVMVAGDGSTTRIYLNGNSTAVASGTDTISYVAAGLTLGSYFGNNYYYNGLIDELSIYSSDQSSNLSTIYNSGTPDDLPTTDLQAWWRLGDGTENGSGTTIYDMSTNSHNGTLSGDAAITSIGSGESVYV